MRYFYDTEFIDHGKYVQFLSIGIVDEDGCEYYAITNDDHAIGRAIGHEWLRANVVPHLPVTVIKEKTAFECGTWVWDLSHPAYACVKPRATIAVEVLDFVSAAPGYPELWAYFAAYDHVMLSQLYGRMLDLPAKMPMFTHELMQLWESVGCPDKPGNNGVEHDALADARWNRALFDTCVSVKATR